MLSKIKNRFGFGSQRVKQHSELAEVPPNTYERIAELVEIVGLDYTIGTIQKLKSNVEKEQKIGIEMAGLLGYYNARNDKNTRLVSNRILVSLNEVASKIIEESSKPGGPGGGPSSGGDPNFWTDIKKNIGDIKEDVVLNTAVKQDAVQTKAQVSAQVSEEKNTNDNKIPSTGIDVLQQQMTDANIAVVNSSNKTPEALIRGAMEALEGGRLANIQDLIDELTKMENASKAGSEQSSKIGGGRNPMNASIAPTEVFEGLSDAIRGLKMEGEEESDVNTLAGSESGYITRDPRAKRGADQGPASKRVKLDQASQASTRGSSVKSDPMPQEFFPGMPPEIGAEIEETLAEPESEFGSIPGSDFGGSMGGEVKTMTDQIPEGQQEGQQATPTLSGQATEFTGKGAKYHREAIAIFFGSADEPKWDNSLNNDIEKANTTSQYRKDVMNAIVNGEGFEILVLSVKTDTLDEFKEIMQLHFSLKRNMARGSRVPTATVPLGQLLAFRNTLVGQEAKPMIPTSSPGDILPVAKPINIGKAWENRSHWQSGPSNPPIAKAFTRQLQPIVYDELGPGLESTDKFNGRIIKVEADCHDDGAVIG